MRAHARTHPQRSKARTGLGCRPVGSVLPRVTSGGSFAMGGDLVVTERFISQQEAARLAGCSKDTIVRARRSGRLPHARLREHRWAVPVDDLVAAGLYQPAGQDTDAVPLLVGEGSESTSIELARALARVAALEDVVARQDDELRFLRQLTVETLGKRGAG
jgi:excisionase family DNA binding protein